MGYSQLRLAFGGDPSTVNYDAALLRAHLIKYFHNNLIVAFSGNRKACEEV